MPPKEFSRARRVADQLRRELAEMLLREVNDPRFAAVTLSHVEVSRDLSHAKVFVALPPDVDVEATLKALNKASGYLRHGLAQRLYLRYLPALRFEHDTALERAHRLSDLIDAAVAEDERRGRGPEGDEEGHEGGRKA